jgi:hypothetical protein
MPFPHQIKALIVADARGHVVGKTQYIAFSLRLYPYIGGFDVILQRRWEDEKTLYGLPLPRDGQEVRVPWSTGMCENCRPRAPRCTYIPWLVAPAHPCAPRRTYIPVGKKKACMAGPGLSSGMGCLRTECHRRNPARRLRWLPTVLPEGVLHRSRHTRYCCRPARPASAFHWR